VRAPARSTSSRARGDRRRRHGARLEDADLADVGGDASQISTDTHPDPAFYQTSVDQAIAKHEPFVVIFATPKFCTSAQCGPTLDSIKPYVAKYPTVTFINVEPYKLKLVDGALQADTDATGALQATSVTTDNGTCSPSRWSTS
jgi:hypothetical protein